MPENQGKNLPKTSRRYELFRAGQFRSHYDPHKRGVFVRQPPLDNKKRRELWEGYYRVKVDGKWLAPGRYECLTLDWIFGMILKDAQ